MQIRKLILSLHLIAGLTAAIFLIILGVTGAEMAFELQIDDLLNPTPRLHPTGNKLSLTELKSKLESARPGFQVSGIVLSQADDLPITAMLVSREQKKNDAFPVNPYTGEILSVQTNQNNFVTNVHQFHMKLLAGKTGATVVTCASIFLLFLSITGLVLWWPRKIFKMKLGPSGKRFNFDLHNAIGIYSSIFMFMFALTGIVLHWGDEIAKWVNQAVTTPAAQQPLRPETPAPGAIPLNPDQLVALAEKAEPGTIVTFIRLSDNPKTPVSVSLKFPVGFGGATVLLDGYSGKVLFAQDSRTAPLGTRIKVWSKIIHTGAVFGWFGKVLIAFLSLMLPVLSITGPLIWWGRRKKKSVVIPETAPAT